jgi:hypothetical protein
MPGASRIITGSGVICFGPNSQNPTLTTAWGQDGPPLFEIFADPAP